MKIIDIKVPSPGESITEVEIANWLVSQGDYVQKDQEICEIDSDKATLTINADVSGTINIIVESGEMIEVGSIICKINTSTNSPDTKSKSTPLENKPKKEADQIVHHNESQLVEVASPAAKKLIREFDVKDIKKWANHKTRCSKNKNSDG